MTSIAVAVCVAALAGLVLSHQQGPAPAPPMAGQAAARPAPASTSRPSPVREAPPLLRLESQEPHGPARLEGQVIDAARLPVEGAQVSLGTVPLRTVLTERDGTFSFERLQPRSYTLQARRGALAAEPVEVRLTPTSEPVILVLRPTVPVEVSVLDARERHPLEGARVEVEGQEGVAVMTGSDGKALLQGLAAGRHVIRASVEGHAPERATVLHTPQAASVSRVTLLVQVGAPVLGEVVDSEGRPVLGASVRALRTGSALPESENIVEEVLTTSEGVWRMRALPEGTFRFMATHARFAPSLSEQVTLEGLASPPSVRIVLRPGAVLFGQVVERSGAPAPFARIQARQGGAGGLPGTRHGTFADASGRFELRGLPHTRFQVDAQGERASSLSQDVDLGSGAAEVTLRLEAEGSIAGVVAASDGAPVASAQVVAIPEDRAALGALTESHSGRYASDVSDGSGRFRLPGLAPGRYRLRASVHHSVQSSSFWLATGVMAKVGDEDVRILLESPGTLRGRVELSDGEVPESFSVALTLSQPTAFQGTQGAFVLADVPPGHYTLTFLSRGSAPRTLEGVEVGAGADTDLGLVVLEEGRRLRGVVRDAEGVPVPGAEVLAGPQLLGDGSQAGPAPLRSVSDASGHFALTGGGEAALTVMAEHSTRGRSSPLVVAAGAASDALELTLRPLAGLEGTVTRQGHPVGNVAVVAAPRGSSTGRFMVMTQADGRYRFARLSKGQYVVTAALREGSTEQLLQSVLAQVEERGAPRDIQVALGGHALSIQVLEADDQPLQNAQVYLGTGPLGAVTLEQLEAVLAARGEGQTRILLLMKGQPLTVTALAPGAYTLCVVPVRGNLDDPTWAQRVRDGASQLPVSCEPVEIGATGTPRPVVHRLPPVPSH
ncbi:carboxypeptidase-like regulatory domain-containing protein [Myxococcus eversor]|uniref:carboxypeptidase-like regulatory domain-containing protein n=1 Tax=Myxococcus eversor TaxID=2709661 RepID=UPI0013D518C2|nr:carboxypeptidase-like regulatory domain-containing protein [Myxococcus eversor]